MPLFFKPDPYDGFKSDRERRRALNTRVRARTILLVIAAVAGGSHDWMETARWLTSLLH